LKVTYPLALISQTLQLFALRVDHPGKARLSVRLRKPRDTIA
jgi:hypothetical protein